MSIVVNAEFQSWLEGSGKPWEILSERVAGQMFFLLKDDSACMAESLRLRIDGLGFPF